MLLMGAVVVDSKAFRIQGASVRGANARILHHADMNACNTFESPDTITPGKLDVKASGGGIAVELPPLAVVGIEARLS